MAKGYTNLKIFSPSWALGLALSFFALTSGLAQAELNESGSAPYTAPAETLPAGAELPLDDSPTNLDLQNSPASSPLTAVSPSPTSEAPPPTSVSPTPAAPAPRRR